MSSEYVVVGSGIVGLYTVFSLIDNASVDPKSITVIAEYLPGDQSINYTSPWAGGNFSCISGSDEESLFFDKYTYTNLPRIQKLLGGPSCGLDNLPSAEHWNSYPDERKIKSLSSYLKNFKILEKSQLEKGSVSGISFTTWNFDCPQFLSKFKLYLESEGVTFVREKLTHISQAYLGGTKVVFNCSGIGARTLVGDQNVYPTRGQVVVIRAPHIQQNKIQWGDDFATYIIPRPYSGGELVLGGYMQKGNFTGDTFGYQTEDIIERTTKLLPQIKDKPIEIIRVAAGLRPSRHGGVRIELEYAGDGKILIHNYGASGYGYQSGFGMAFKATSLLKEFKAGKKSKL